MVIFTTLNSTKKEKDYLLDGALADKVASKGEINQAVFGHGFGGITDIEVGPDGYLYVLTFGEEDGTIYRILPAENSQQEIVSEEDYT